MFSYLRHRMKTMDVIQTSSYILIKDIDKWAMFKDINLYWESNLLSKWMFMSSSSSDIKFQHFFLPDFIYMVRKLYAAKRTQLPKRTYEKVIELLMEKTWIGDAETKPTKSVINEKSLGSLSPWPLKHYQEDFIKHYGLAVPAYRLEGYMLDAGTGSGKTMTAIEWADALGVKHVIVICPPNVVASVWGEHLRKVIKVPKRAWLSVEDQPLSLDYDYYVVHFNQLEKITAFLKQHVKDFKNTALILDESHHLNKKTSDRSVMAVDISSLPHVDHTLWQSATPISALGLECIPFLKTTDPYFTHDVEERFRRIYGRSARKANEILQNRMGILKYHIPKQDLPDVTQSHYDVLVKIPHGNDYSLSILSKVLRDHMTERLGYFEKHREDYTKTYDECIELFKQTLHTNEITAFDTYRKYIDIIRKGYDPREHRELSMYCNTYERKTIIPRLPEKKRAPFRQAKSVVKYPHLKALGESLGLLGKYRVDCHVAMADYIDFESLIDSAQKKTVIFTSYLEVVSAVEEKLKSQGYTPLVVHGGNSKSLQAILKEFSDNPDANPLITTFQSLSTGVPLTMANRTLYLNYPFRDSIKTQADGRTARLGQDKPCDYYGYLLDTGSEPNISTRNQDIMAWSADQVSAILGTKNLDLDTLSMEGDVNYMVDDNTYVDDDDLMNATFESAQKGQGVPPFLYHGSGFKQSSLMPGFKHSGVETRWDKYESNHWLYATSCKDEAILLGIASAAEKKHETNRFRYDLAKRQIVITGKENYTLRHLKELEVYIYTLSGNPKDGWVKNINPHNDILTEWKTEDTLDTAIVKVERLNIESFLFGWSIRNSHE